MDEYIERERLRGMLKDHYYPTDQEHEYDRQWAVGFNAGLDKALHKIRYAPAADVAPVVRCKECKHYHAKTGWCNVHSSFVDSHGAACHPWESSDWKMFEPDDFCSYGEREG